MLTFSIKLTPVSKKNSQQLAYNPATKRMFITPSKKYKEYEKQALWYLTPKPEKPIDYPVTVTCLFYMPTRRRVDLTNLLEAADDVLVRGGILADDHCGIVVSHDGSRVLYSKDNPRTEIYITELED